jgi:hypothetical protein
MWARLLATTAALIWVACGKGEGPRGGVDDGRGGSAMGGAGGGGGGGGGSGSGGGPSGNGRRPPGPIPPTGPLPGGPCEYTLDEYRERVAGEDSIPEWAAVDCFTRDLVRKPMPKFLKRYNMAQDESLARKPRESQLQWDHFSVGSSNPAVNLSSGLVSGVAPWFDLMKQQVYTYPLDPAHLDRKLRGAAPFFITDKRKGWRTLFVQFYPPGTVVPGVVDVASWKRWVTDFYVPEKVTEAKYAERLKFEIYDPWVGELEIMINTLPFTRDLPALERVALGQWLADTIFPAVRPHFHGQLLGVSYTRYEVTGEEWNRLSFKGWDAMTAGVFPECDLATTRAYMAKQLPHVLKVVENSQGIPWYSGEIFVNKQLFVRPGCLTEAQYWDEEPKIYQAIIDAIEAAAVKPSGFLADHDLIHNPETRRVIEAYWNSKPD